MFGSLPGVCRQLPRELAPPGIDQLLLPVDATLTKGEFNIGTLQTTLAQLFTNA
ncbi:hypothetical protein D3C78_1713020 [compost metagenome]